MEHGLAPAALSGLSVVGPVARPTQTPVTRWRPSSATSPQTSWPSRIETLGLSSRWRRIVDSNSGRVKVQDLDADRQPRRPAVGIEDPDVFPLLHQVAAGFQEVGLHPGEELLDRHQAALQDEVEMAGVRHTRAVLRAGGR